jgi:Domain of unknown function (DUF4340)
LSRQRLVVLLVLALAVTAGAIWLSSPRSAQRNPGHGTPVLPGLAARLDAVTSLRLVGAGSQPLVTLSRDDARWIVGEAGYPADPVRVRRLLVALGELQVLEPKTDDPARYPALAVEDVEDPKAQSLRLELGGLAEPVALIVGHAAAGRGAFVRVPGQRQALEARPALDVARAPRDWLARTIVDVAPARVQAVEVERSDAPAWRAVKAARDAAHFDVPGLPKGRELTSPGAADPAGNALGNLEFDEVRRAEPTPAHARPQRTLVRCFDGLIVTLEGRTDGEARWLTLAASFDAELAARFPPAAGQAAPGADQVRAEAERITATARGWEYKLPPYRFDAIFRKRDELLRH